MTPPAQAIYDRADLMIVVGSRLRGNETRNNAMRLPRPLVQIDADAGQAARNYAVDLFINADAPSALEGLCQRLPAKLDVDAKFLGDVAGARKPRRSSRRRSAPTASSPTRCRRGSRKAAIRSCATSRCRTARSATVVHLAAPHLGVHALGGGIGQGIAMAVGAALGRRGEDGRAHR